MHNILKFMAIYWEGLFYHYDYTSGSKGQIMIWNVSFVS